MANKNKSELFTSLLYILIGVLLIVFRAETLGWAMAIAGVFFIVSGILDLVKRNLIGGAVSLAIGITILVLGWVAIEIVLFVLGLLIAIKGIVTLISVLTAKRKNALMIVFPAISILAGLILALAFESVLNIALIVVGVLLAIDGVVGLLSALKK